jgi:hypothetical protein
MINLFKIKGQKKDDAATANGKPAVKKQSPGELRLHKGLLSWEQSFSTLPLCVLFIPMLTGSVVLHNCLLFFSSILFIFLRNIHHVTLICRPANFVVLCSLYIIFLSDIAELNLPKTTKITFPNGKDDLMNFEATIKPDEGYYV